MTNYASIKSLLEQATLADFTQLKTAFLDAFPGNKTLVRDFLSWSRWLANEVGAGPEKFEIIKQRLQEHLPSEEFDNIADAH